MKKILVILLLFVLAGFRGAVAQDGSRVEDPVRKIPPVRISISSLYQQWTQEGASLHEWSIPVTAQLRLRPDFGVSVGFSQASAGGDDLEQVSGLTDVRLAFDYHIRLQKTQMILNLAVHMPTGASQFADNAYATAFRLSLSQYDFQVPYFGQGGRVAPGLALVTAVMDNLVLSVGATYRVRGSFEPIADLPEVYKWGNELLFAVGGVWQLKSTLSLSGDAVFTRYGADTIGGATVYEAGRRITAQAQLHKTLPRHDFWLGFRYRTVDTNRISLGGTLQPEVARAFPGLLELSGHYRVRLSPWLRGTLYAEASRYEADFEFEQTDIYGIGFAPEISLAPAVTIPIRFKYAFGDLDGIEAGLGIVAVL